MKNITLLLAEDHTVVRQGIRRLLEAEADMTVVAEATSGREALNRALRYKPDVVIMDIAMPLLNGLEATRQILKAAPNARILILSAHGDDAYVDQAIRAGASGFVLKQASGNALARAVRKVWNGSHFFSPEIEQRFFTALSPQKRGKDMKNLPELTPREREVLQLVAEGKANKQTADELKISIKTVEKHRTNLMRKLNLHNTASLTRYAISVGVIEGGDWE